MPPPPNEVFPFLSDPSNPSLVSLVSFAHRPQASGEDFYDYTARYGAVREEDKTTLRQSMFPDSIPFRCPDLDDGSGPEYATIPSHDEALFSELISKMDLASYLDLPLIALSNGQTRRARVVKAILTRPQLLILDEPLSMWRLFIWILFPHFFSWIGCGKSPQVVEHAT